MRIVAIRPSRISNAHVPTTLPSRSRRTAPGSPFTRHGRTTVGRWASEPEEAEPGAPMGAAVVLFEAGGRLPLRWFRHNPMVLLQSLLESVLTAVAVYYVLRWFDVRTGAVVVARDEGSFRIFGADSG